jgi:hypothetical protein
MLAGLIVMALAVPAWGQVHIDIGIRLPAPPTLTVIPGVPVYYAPQAPANVFFYGHQYWLFHGNGWYVGPTWNGPWVVVEPIHLPVPILRVPVRYYVVRPSHWHGWHHDAPPRWDGHWGREWREAAHERDWREREERWAHGKRDKDDGKPGRGRGRGRGHDK